MIKGFFTAGGEAATRTINKIIRFNTRFKVSDEMLRSSENK